jgi:hypothetical protein
VSKATELVERDGTDYFSRRVPAEVADAFSALFDKSIVIVVHGRLGVGPINAISQAYCRIREVGFTRC